MPPAASEAPSTLLSYEQILAARARLAGIANETPVFTSRTLDARTGRRVFLKCESFQRGGAFKFRGAYNKIAELSAEQRRRGVVAFSSGNHAQGVALAARLLGAPATIAMPSDVPEVKLAATREYGAEVVFYDRQVEEREDVATRLAGERGLTLVPPYDDPAIMAGQGTAAAELLESTPDLDALLVPVSGGGLAAGCATAAHALRPELKVFGVEPEDAEDTRLSLAAGERVTIPPPSTVADGLRVSAPGRLTFPILKRRLTGVLIVSDEEILDAVRFALLRMKLVVEPSGAIGIAALLARRLPDAFRLPDACRRVGVIVSGGNIDPALLASLGSGREPSSELSAGQPA
ncbi:MAG: pyridoxal-phosphate dependent enzyme [Gemmatimonadetes bacterium]|nr:pyridoxal-phosphate dependent enzyme [Gemmatimonadota bacterium]